MCDIFRPVYSIEITNFKTLIVIYDIVGWLTYEKLALIDASFADTAGTQNLGSWQHGQHHRSGNLATSSSHVALSFLLCSFLPLTITTSSLLSLLYIFIPCCFCCWLQKEHFLHFLFEYFWGKIFYMNHFFRKITCLLFFPLNKIETNICWSWKRWYLSAILNKPSTDTKVNIIKPLLHSKRQTCALVCSMVFHSWFCQYSEIVLLSFS